MASVAARPVLRSPTVFSLPTRGRRHAAASPPDPPTADMSEPTLDERRQQRAIEVEEASVGRAQAYVEDFLRKSEWSDQLDSITVHWDMIPNMDELESYGTLDATEGTRMCRRFFKAVVVWDELGHGLWMRLQKTSQQRKAALKGLGPMLMMDAIASEASLPLTPGLAPRKASSQTQFSDSPSTPSSLTRRRSNESSESVNSRSSSRSSVGESRSTIPKILRTITGIRKQSS